MGQSAINAENGGEVAPQDDINFALLPAWFNEASSYGPEIMATGGMTDVR